MLGRITTKIMIVGGETPWVGVVVVVVDLMIGFFPLSVWTENQASGRFRSNCLMEAW